MKDEYRKKVNTIQVMEFQHTILEDSDQAHKLRTSEQAAAELNAIFGKKEEK